MNPQDSLIDREYVRNKIIDYFKRYEFPVKNVLFVFTVSYVEITIIYNDKDIASIIFSHEVLLDFDYIIYEFIDRTNYDVIKHEFKR